MINVAQVKDRRAAPPPVAATSNQRISMRLARARCAAPTDATEAGGRVLCFRQRASERAPEAPAADQHTHLSYISGVTPLRALLAAGAGRGSPAGDLDVRRSTHTGSTSAASRHSTQLLDPSVTTTL